MSKQYAVTTLAVGALVLCWSGVAAAAPVEWVSGSGGNGHWYEIIRDTSSPYMTWTEAKNAAESASYLGMQGHLATLTSQNENDFVGNTTFLGASYHALYGDNVWIGGFQYDKADEPDGHWSWVTGETWSWTNWEPGTPNNGGPHNVEDYLKLGANQWNIGMWNDNNLQPGTGGGYGAAYIIEYEPSAVPIPAAVWLFGSGLLGLIGFSRRKKAV